MRNSASTGQFQFTILFNNFIQSLIQSIIKDAYLDRNNTTNADNYSNVAVSGVCLRFVLFFTTSNAAVTIRPDNGDDETTSAVFTTQSDNGDDKTSAVLTIQYENGDDETNSEELTTTSEIGNIRGRDKSMLSFYELTCTVNYRFINGSISNDRDYWTT